MKESTSIKHLLHSCLRTGRGSKAVFLLFLLAATFFTSCEEVEEAGAYDNWRERNEAFIDSLKQETGDMYVGTIEQAQAIEPGKLFAIRDLYSSTDATPQYIYCRKLKATDENAERPLYTGSVTAFYYGTLINGEKFDGNFTGYSALDRDIPLPPEKVSTEFDSPTDFSVSGVISGWTTVLQYMREGDRWIVYIPWMCGYGSSGNSTGTILGYSTLTFDMELVDVRN